LRAVFVAGGHTDVGKTHAACALIAAARGRGRSAAAFKPLVSGFDPGDWRGSDPGRLLAALGRPLVEAELEAISPWRFRAPLAPPMAARLDGQTIDPAELALACKLWLGACSADLALLEGVGGVMSPLTEAQTGLDLMAALGLPVVLVGGGYLGAISHTLTADLAIRARGLDVAAVIVSQDADPDAPDFAETVATMARFLPDRRVFAAPRSDDLAWARCALDALM